MLTVALLVVGNIVWYFWSNWGLITIHSKDKPLGEIIHSIEKQGHVTIKTNIDLSKPIQMYVNKVALAEALETLSVVAEGRWRLTYVVAPDKGTIGNALSSLTSQQRPEGWLSKYVPLRAMGPMGLAGAEPDVLPDPRKDTWTVKPASPATLQAYLEQASRNVSASFFVQELWNPAISSAPPSGPIAKVLPKLISKAGGRYEEVFMIMADRFRPGEGDPRPPDDEDRRAQFREAMEERIQNEINKLPPDQRAAAQQEHDDQKQLFETIRNLPPEERAAKIQEVMSDPNVQQKIEDANLARDSRRSPQQRMQKGNQYVQRLGAARQAAASAAGK